MKEKLAGHSSTEQQNISGVLERTIKVTPWLNIRNKTINQKL